MTEAKQYDLAKGITLADEEGAYLLDFIPALRVIKLRHRDKLFVVDLDRLADLHARGIRNARVKPSARTFPEPEGRGKALE